MRVDNLRNKQNLKTLRNDHIQTTVLVVDQGNKDKDRARRESRGGREKYKWRDCWGEEKDYL